MGLGKTESAVEMFHLWKTLWMHHDKGRTLLRHRQILLLLNHWPLVQQLSNHLERSKIKPGNPVVVRQALTL